jgi:hypothetical protein
MNITELENEWEQDCSIDEFKLDLEALKCSKLHSKYLRLLIDSKLKIVKLKQDYLDLRQNKFRWIQGKMTKQELETLGWEQYLYSKPLKSETDELLKGDAQLVSMEAKIEYIQTMVYMLEEIIKSIKGRNFEIRAAIDWKRFIAGN